MKARNAKQAAAASTQQSSSTPSLLATSSHNYDCPGAIHPSVSTPSPVPSSNVPASSAFSSGSLSSPSGDSMTSRTPDASAPSSDNDTSATAPPLPLSPSALEWQRQKDVEGEDNPSIDAIMEMTGLEDVKAQVLRIKGKIDVSKRQGTSVKDERFNIVLQGNPGTGVFCCVTGYGSKFTPIIPRKNYRCSSLCEVPSFGRRTTRHYVC